MVFFRKSLKKKEEAKPREVVKEKTEKKTADVSRGKNAAWVVRNPRLTEKTSAAGAQNKFVFVVEKAANKNQVKRDIEARFGVEVRAVHVINLPAKPRMKGKQIGWKKGFKKAVVTVKEGQKIEIS